VNIKRLRVPRRKNIRKVKATTTKIILPNWNYTSNSIDENINDIIIIGNEQSVAEAKKKIEALIQNMMMESTFIIPPLQSPLKAKSRLDKTPMQQHQQNMEKTIWMEEEKKIFKEKFSPKTENNFAKVSEFINKNVQECIQFYYLNKKKENLRKKETRAGHQKADNISQVTTISKNGGDNSGNLIGNAVKMVGKDGVVTVKVGGATEPQMDAKKDGVTDADIVPGCSNSLLNSVPASNEDQCKGLKIVCHTLKQPMMEIAKNVGMDASVNIDKVMEANDCNLSNDAVNVIDARVIGPTKISGAPVNSDVTASNEEL
jgi:hypothetical protein